MIRVAILIDNTPDAKSVLHSEKGLSLYVEDDKNRILCDTGLSGAFADNAKALALDVSNVDFCFLSHAHIDHTGGLHHFLDINKNSTVYIAEEAIAARYFSYRHARSHDLSVDFDLVKANANRMHTLRSSAWLTENVAAVFCSQNLYAQPFGNKYLTKKRGATELPDDFAHEMSLAIVEGDELIVVSSCSHCGAANIIETCKAFTGKTILRAFVGGLHFVDDSMAKNEAENLLSYVNKHAKHAKFYIGHCTSEPAKAILCEQEQFCAFATGDIISI